MTQGQITTSRLWPDQHHGPWLLVFYWQTILGRPECVGLAITSTTHPHGGDHNTAMPEVGRPLHTTTLRGLRLADLIYTERINSPDLAPAPPSEPDGTAYAPPGMRSATWRKLELVARTYRHAQAEGKHPTRAVANRLRTTHGAAANLVLRAREVGLLPPAGRAGNP